MSEININGTKWTDLVFDGKNKSYGAYQLRRENGRTTLKAFFVGILFVGSLCGGGLMMSSFGGTNAIAPVAAGPELNPAEDVIFITLPEKPAAPKKAEPLATTPETPKPNSGNMVAAPLDNDTEANPTNTSSIPETSGSSGSVEGTETPTAGTAPTGTAVTPAGPYRKGALDVQPRFPGGIEKFYKYVGSNFKRPELDVEKKMTVLVSFVIEIDGSFSDIRVLQNPGEGLDKEAIRVLKALKTKWEPGIKDGKPVRTIYTLPITVVSE